MTQRHVSKLAVFLLLGAIVNVAVAWGLTLWLPVHDCTTEPDTYAALVVWWERNYPFAQTSRPHLIDHRNDRPVVLAEEDRYATHDGPVTEDYAHVMKRAGLVATMVSGTDPGSILAMTAEVVSIAAGWPCLSVQGEHWSREGNRAGSMLRLEQYVHAIKPTSFALHPIQDELTFATNGRLLPWQPLWPGFAINTVFYAAILWLLFFTPGALRRRRRIKRRLCPACAYPVGTSPVCTECGVPVTPRRGGGM